MPDADPFPGAGADDADIAAARDAARMASRASAIGAEEDREPPSDPGDDEFSDEFGDDRRGSGDSSASGPTGDPGA